MTYHLTPIRVATYQKKKTEITGVSKNKVLLRTLVQTDANIKWRSRWKYGSSSKN